MIHTKRGLGGPQSLSGRFGDDKSLSPAGTGTTEWPTHSLIAISTVMYVQAKFRNHSSQSFAMNERIHTKFQASVLKEKLALPRQDDSENDFKRNREWWMDYSDLGRTGYNSGVFGYYSKTCLKRTPYIPETWTNGK